MSDHGDTIPAFGQALLRHRRAAGLSQAELARASGMSVRALRELERGRANAAQERSADLLAEALGISGDERQLFLLLAKEGRRRTSKPIDPTVLHSLPVVVTDLVGRERELGELSRLATQSPDNNVVIVVGPPGVGKTSLAVAAAHQLAPSFPGGCLAIDLRGVDDRPMTPQEALERMLVTLGMPTRQIPEKESDRAEAFRMLLRDRKVLLLLDNAVDEAQVRPLLGAGPGCLTLVTCRRVLAGLDGVTLLPLAPLSGLDAVELLASITGEDVVRAEPQAALELALLCGNLPLAVRIAGNRLATRPHWSLSHFVVQLRDEGMRLATLSAGDRQVRSAFEVSFRRLSPLARRVFRRLAAIPGAHFDDELAAVATGVPGKEVGVFLDELVEASLLDSASIPGRLRFHDLIRLFAQELMASEESREECDRLRDETLHHLLARATEAGELFHPHVLDLPEDSTFPSWPAARGWLKREGTNWSAAQRVAAALGWHAEVLALARSMHCYANSSELEARWDEVYLLGLAAVRALGDRAAEVGMLNQLGWAQYMCRNDNELALATSTEALALAVEIDDCAGQTYAHCYIGIELMRLGRVEEGLVHSREAYERSKTDDFFSVRFWIGNALGAALREAGRFGAALALHQTLLAEVRDSESETNAGTLWWVTMLLMENIGLCLAGLGRWREAAASHHDARVMAAAAQSGHHEAEQAVDEGLAWREAGELERARESLLHARELLDGPVYRADRERVNAELVKLDALLRPLKRD